MRIALVSLYDLHSYAIRPFHTTLEKAGHEVCSFFFYATTYGDKICSDDDIRLFAAMINYCRPDVTAISVRSPLFPVFKKLQIVSKVMVGGPHATLRPEDFAGYADLIVRGDGDRAILDVDKTGVVTAGMESNLNDVPLPYYGPNSVYYNCHLDRDMEEVHLYTSRGCSLSCSYCYEGTRKGRHRKPVDKVMDEIRYHQMHFPKMKSVMFSDPIFTRDREWLDEFCTRFSKTGLKFRCMSHVNFINEDRLKMLLAAGMDEITFGVESASVRIQKLFNRPESLERVLKISELTSKYNAKVRWDFIINNPFETADDIMLTKKFIQRLSKPCMIRHFELRFFPGLEITNKALFAGHITPEQVEGNYTRTGAWSYNYEIN